MKRDLKRNISAFARCRRYFGLGIQATGTLDGSSDLSAAGLFHFVVRSGEALHLCDSISRSRPCPSVPETSVRVAELPIVAPLADGLRPVAQVDLMFHAQTPALARRSHRHYSEMCLGTPPSLRGAHSRLETRLAHPATDSALRQHFRLSRLPGNPTGDLLLWTFCSPSKSSANWVPIDRPSKSLQSLGVGAPGRTSNLRPLAPELYRKRLTR
jgi:hypothetical protein